MFRLFACAAWACAFANGAPSASETQGVLEKVRLGMIENLMHLPNYTCLETVERSVRRAPSRHFELFDLIRLEVALVNGRELFSWPGAGKFEEKDIDEIVPGGAIGTGSFALHAKAVFQGSPSYKFIGEEFKNGRKLLRWDFRVPLLSSGFTLKVSGKQAVVGYHGTFWADAETLDVTRLEVDGDDIPLDIHLLRAGDSVDYMRADIGGASFLLPRESELHMTDDTNTESVNRIRFSSCRQYLGESKLIFSDPDDSSPPTAEQAETVTLPDGITLTLALETPIHSGVTAVGDPLSFVLKKDLKRDGIVYFEKGAVVHGRVTLLRKEHTPPADGWALGIVLSEIQSRLKHATINATLLEDGVPAALDNYPSMRSPAAFTRKSIAEILPKAPGSVFFVRGTTLNLMRGMPMYWRIDRTTTNGDKQ
jgi:hypothetical protein